MSEANTSNNTAKGTATHSTETGLLPGPGAAGSAGSAKVAIASAITEFLVRDLERLGYSTVAIEYIYDRLVDSLSAEEWSTLQAVGEEILQIPAQLLVPEYIEQIQVDKDGE